MKRVHVSCLLAALIATHAIADGPYLGTRPVPGSTAPRIVKEGVGFKRIQVAIAQFSVPTDWQPKPAVVGVDFLSASGAETNVIVLSHANARPPIAAPRVTISNTLAHFCTAPYESGIEVVNSNPFRHIALGYCKEVGQAQAKPYFLFVELRTPTHILHIMRAQTSDLRVAKSELSALAESATLE
ncbi:MAG: hypothetical protein V4669_04775 [Pseudomonadota bacterium]